MHQKLGNAQPFSAARYAVLAHPPWSTDNQAATRNDVGSGALPSVFAVNWDESSQFRFRIEDKCLWFTDTTMAKWCQHHNALCSIVSTKPGCFNSLQQFLVWKTPRWRWNFEQSREKKASSKHVIDINAWDSWYVFSDSWHLPIRCTFFRACSVVPNHRVSSRILYKLDVIWISCLWGLVRVGIFVPTGPPDQRGSARRLTCALRGINAESRSSINNSVGDKRPSSSLTMYSSWFHLCYTGERIE